MAQPPDPPEPSPVPGPVPAANWAVSVVRSLTIQNVLTIALLAMVATPSYFAWKFLTDDAFRHEFMSSARVVSAKVPCVVIIGNLGFKEERHTVFTTYRTVGRMEYIIGVQASGTVSDAELGEICRAIHTESDLLTKAREDREELARERERGQVQQGTPPKLEDH